MAFTFGLLHGFGFAGALHAVGLPQNAIPLALLLFNVGVELGQLLFIASVMAALTGAAFIGRRLSRLGIDPKPAYAASESAAAYAIGSVAAFWLYRPNAELCHLNKPGDEIQWLEHDMGSAIAIGRFQSVVDKTLRRQ